MFEDSRFYFSALGHGRFRGHTEGSASRGRADASRAPVGAIGHDRDVFPRWALDHMRPRPAEPATWDRRGLDVVIPVQPAVGGEDGTC